MAARRVRARTTIANDGDHAAHSNSTAAVNVAAAAAMKPAVVALIECRNCASLAELCLCEDIWETICSELSGDALCCTANVSKVLRCATRKTAAFTLLAGIDNDADVVPWDCPTNVLSAKYVHYNCIYDREYEALRAAECMLRSIAYPEYLRHKIQRHHRSYVCSGPARPPSPAGTTHATYDPYIRPAFRGGLHRLNPPVFGPRAGFSYAPFWDILVNEGESCDDDED